MDDLLTESDFVVCTAPLTEETKGKFNKETFSRMKSSAIFVNIDRGGHVIESHLIEAIKQNEIRGVALDVDENETIANDHRFLNIDQIIIVPQIGSSTIETRNNMVQLCVDTAEKSINADSPITPVNK